jgi:hypothetical protein
VGVHRARRGVGVAPAQRCDDGLVPRDRSFRPSLLLQRPRARLDQQIVQDAHDPHHRPVAGGAGQHGVEGGVLDDRRPARLDLPPLRVDDALQVGEVVVGDAHGRGAGDRRFEHPAQVQELVAQIVAVGQHRRQRRHQPAHVELARERALAVAAFDQPDGLEHPQRVADRAPAHAEAGGEEALAGKRPAGAEGAVENQDADAVGDFLGHPGFLDRLQQAGRAFGRLPPRRSAALDRPGGGCQTLSLNWSYHWASLAQGA